MPQQFRHLQYDERWQIHSLHQQGASVGTIAAQIQRHPSTVCCELRSYAGPPGYRHEEAYQLAQQCRHEAFTDLHKLHPPVWNRIRNLLRHHRSPEQTASRPMRSGMVSLNLLWLYQRIHQGYAERSVDAGWFGCSRPGACLHVVP